MYLDMFVSEESRAIAAALIFGLLGLLALAWVATKANDSQKPIALIFPTWFEREQSFAAIAQAEGTLIRYGATENVIIAQFNSLSLDDIKNITGAIGILDPLAAGSCNVLQ